MRKTLVSIANGLVPSAQTLHPLVVRAVHDMQRSEHE